jgi:hypothetical protein
MLHIISNGQNAHKPQVRKQNSKGKGEMAMNESHGDNCNHGQLSITSQAIQLTDQIHHQS